LYLLDRLIFSDVFDCLIACISGAFGLLCRSSSAGDPSAQECLQLVVRATQVFREEYIQKFEQAREEIARRYYCLFNV